MNIYAHCEKCPAQAKVIWGGMGFAMPEGWVLAKRTNEESGITLCDSCSPRLYKLIDESYAHFFGMSMPLRIDAEPLPWWRRIFRRAA